MGSVNDNIINNSDYKVSLQGNCKLIKINHTNNIVIHPVYSSDFYLYLICIKT